MSIYPIISRLKYKLGLIDRIDWLRLQGMTIGHSCDILDEVRLDPGHERYITLGDHVTIAPGVFILAHDACTFRALGFTKQARVIIGSRVFIGANALIMPGVTIGNDVIIGAGSVVTKDIPYGSVAYGNPATVQAQTQELLSKRTRNHNIGGNYGIDTTAKRQYQQGCETSLSRAQAE